VEKCGRTRQATDEVMWKNVVEPDRLQMR